MFSGDYCDGERKIFRSLILKLYEMDSKQQGEINNNYIKILISSK